MAERIERPVDVVYAYVSDPANIPEWAPGLGGRVERSGADWFVETPMGRVRLTFAPPNEYGVLDHEVTLATGERFYNPLRVVPYGEGSEIIFTVRRAPGVSDADFDRDVATVAADLAGLRTIPESRH
jgi:uncharacterized protein YndB with AHSA1/START domain